MDEVGTLLPGRRPWSAGLVRGAAVRWRQIETHHVAQDLNDGHRGLAFGAVDGVRFRGTVEPGARMLIMARARKMRSNIGIYDSQAYVDGSMVYEGLITGMILPA